MLIDYALLFLILCVYHLQVKAMLGAKKLLAEKKGPTKSTKATKSAQAGAVSSFDAMDTMLLLSRCPDVPAASSVASAEKLLVQIQALSPTTNALTPLGVHLSTLPCMPRIGRLAVYGALLGCAYSATVVGACMSVRSPFNPSQDAEVVRAVNRAKVRIPLIIFFDSIASFSDCVLVSVLSLIGSIFGRLCAAVGLHGVGEFSERI